MNIQTKINSVNGILIIFILLVTVLYIINPVIAAHTNVAIAFALSRIFIWIIVLFIFLYSTKIEKQPLLIWKEKQYSFSILFVHVFLLFVTLCIGAFVIVECLKLFKIHFSNERLHQILILFRKNFLLLLFTCFTAGFTEELLFRGYIQTRISIFFKKPIFPILISAFIFAILHLSYRSANEFIGAFYIGIVFAFYYWKYKSIKTLMIAHFLYDLMVITIQTYFHK